jgi:hypothetical protein
MVSIVELNTYKYCSTKITMDELELKEGEKIGVFFYDDWRGCKVVIEEIQHISSGGTITLKTGTRYNRNGKEVGALGEGTYLCSVEEAKAIIGKADRELETEPGLRTNRTAKAAVRAVVRTLNQYGWHSDTDGDMEQMKSDIENIIKKYLEQRGS